MKAWIVEQFGSLEDLAFRDVPVPSPGPGTVLVKVSKAGLNFADGIAVRGRYQVRTPPPFVLGSEIAGIVAEADEASGFAPGDRVMAQVPAGAFGEYCIVEAAHLVRLPGELDLISAAALPVSYTTAHVALIGKGGLRPDELVLIHAAAGGLGFAATQIAKWRGARVIATAGSEEKCALAAANGADHVLTYRSEDWTDKVRALAPQGPDMVLDPVGGETTLRSLRLLAWGGRLLLAGFAGGQPAAIPANQLLVRAASAIGVFWSLEREAGTIVPIQREIAALAASGSLRPHIGELIPMPELKRGLIALENGSTVGKIILDVDAIEGAN